MTHGLIPSRLPLWAYVVAAAGAFVAARAAMAGAGSDQPAAGSDPAAAVATGTSGDSLWDTFAGVGTGTGAGISGGQFSQAGVFPGSSLADLLDGGIPSTIPSPDPTVTAAPGTCLGVAKPANLGSPGSWVCTSSGWRWQAATSTSLATSTSGYSILVPRLATMRFYTLSSAGCLATSTDKQWTQAGACWAVQTPVTRKSCVNSSSGSVARIIDGPYHGQYVNVALGGVTLRRGSCG